MLQTNSIYVIATNSTRILSQFLWVRILGRAFLGPLLFRVCNKVCSQCVSHDWGHIWGLNGERSVFKLMSLLTEWQHSLWAMRLRASVDCRLLFVLTFLLMDHSIWQFILSKSRRKRIYRERLLARQKLKFYVTLSWKWHLYHLCYLVINY